jgi:hypothetical protein
MRITAVGVNHALAQTKTAFQFCRIQRIQRAAPAGWMLRNNFYRFWQNSPLINIFEQVIELSKLKTNHGARILAGKFNQSVIPAQAGI